MKQGSTELGTGHEDAVGQEEVTEESLCRAGTGEQEEPQNQDSESRIKNSRIKTQNQVCRA